jgi:allophanate hydrolase
MSGVVPACRSLDCPTVFAWDAYDAAKLFSLINGFDSSDAYSRANSYANSERVFPVDVKGMRVGVPSSDNLDFFGDESASQLYQRAIQRWREMGLDVVEVSIDPLLDAAKLLYEGAWVAERYVVLEDRLKTAPESIHPVVRGIVQQGEKYSAAQAFAYEYQMQGVRQVAASLFEEIDFLISPTAPTCYSIAELLDDPVTLNSNMGHYTNYMNLLDLCGVAVPEGLLESGAGFGVTLVAPAFKDQLILSAALAYQQAYPSSIGATDFQHEFTQVNEKPDPAYVDVAVCGAHLSGMPLNWQLIERDAVLVSSTKTSAMYRFYALAGGPPFRPGLIRDESDGVKIEVEVWRVPSQEFGSFVAGIPAPLGIGQLELENGRWVSGFICEPYAVKSSSGAKDISEYGSWRRYIESI